MVSNSTITYIEVIIEYNSIYLNSNLSNNNIILIVVISEWIIILTLLCIYNNINSWHNNTIDGLIINDTNGWIQYINSNLSYVNNVIIYIWYNGNIYNNNYGWWDIELVIWIIVFIELQLKEYINYNSYLNECIFISIIFVLLGIHLLHIIISSILINYSYNIVLVMLIYVLIVVNINKLIVYSVIVLIYWHLVSYLWFIINII